MAGPGKIQRVCAILLNRSSGPPVDNDCVQSVLAQDVPLHQLVIVDDGSPEAKPTWTVRDDRIHHLCGVFSSRAAMLNAAMTLGEPDYLLILQTDIAPIRLRRSCLRAMLMAAGRHTDAGLVYADYTLVEPGGLSRDRHLLHHHAGRLRETADYGRVWLVVEEIARKWGGFNMACRFADLYDFRLRISETHRLIHVANRHGGSLYEVRTSSGGHDVFDYLLAGKEAQLEYEQACTRHLRRIGALLAPGACYKPLRSRGAEPTVHGQCRASVVIPVYRRPEFIGTAIRSVWAQTCGPVETIVVVNGGPDDPTAAEVRRYMADGDQCTAAASPVRLIVLDVNNIGVCLNTGLEAAHSRYYVQLDSDDRLKPDAVEKLLAVFESDPCIGMVIGSYEVWDQDPATAALSRNQRIPVVTHDEWTEENGRNNLLRINGAGAPRAALIEVIREVGGFGVNDSPDSRNYGEDYDLVLRVSERYRIGRVWEPIYEVVRHQGGTDHSIDQPTIDRNDNAKDHMRLEAIQRRRALNSKQHQL